MTKETVTISKESYELLVEDSLFLDCLENAGVGDWIGYGSALGEFRRRETSFKDEINKQNNIKDISCKS